MAKDMRMNVGRIYKTVEKAVREGVTGFRCAVLQWTLAHQPNGLAREWVMPARGGWKKRRCFCPAFAGRWQKRKECGVEIRGVSGKSMGRCGGWVWLEWRSVVSGLCGFGEGGVELSGNIISNYRTFKCERSERTYNFDYVKRKRTGSVSKEISMRIQIIKI